MSVRTPSGLDILLVGSDRRSWAVPAGVFVLYIILRDFKSLSFSLFACGLASLVAVFQISVFSSFLKASSVAIDFINADAWVMAKGIESFDFSYPISGSYGELLLRCFPGFYYERIRSGFATWRSPSGTNSNVAVIAYESAPLSERGYIVDRSDIKRLELQNSDLAEIGRTTASLEATTERLPTFLGVPYIVTSFRLGSSALPFQGEEVSFLGLFSPDKLAVTQSQLDCASDLAPEIDVLPKHDFQNSSARYWTLKTGAGAAILLAAALAMMLNLTVLTHGTNRFIARHSNSLLTLRGHGAPHEFVQFCILFVATFLASSSAAIATALLPITHYIVKPILPWVTSSLGALIALLGLNLVGLAVGHLISKREVKATQIDQIFRT